MINLNRESDVPSSLDTDDIRAYLQECVEYKNDPSGHDKPTPPVSYRSSDLLEAFDRCFYSKCYLTEESFFSSYEMDIEHFISQVEDPALVYEWTNLYPADHNANMSKPRITPEGGYLDPCNSEDDVESQIIYSNSIHGDDPKFDPADTNNKQEVNTANLLLRIHHGHNEISKKKTAGLRHSIHKRHTEILSAICDWYSASNPQSKVQAQNQLIRLLSKKSSYTMLSRSILAVIQLNENNPDIFFD